MLPKRLVTVGDYLPLDYDALEKRFSEHAVGSWKSRQQRLRDSTEDRVALIAFMVTEDPHWFPVDANEPAVRALSAQGWVTVFAQDGVSAALFTDKGRSAAARMRADDAGGVFTAVALLRSEHEERGRPCPDTYDKARSRWERGLARLNRKGG